MRKVRGRVVLSSLISLFLIFSLSQAQADSIVWVGNYNTPGYAMDVVVVDTIAYIADNSSLQIVNVSNPAIPYYVNNCLTGDDVTSLYILGNYVYLIEKNMNGLQIVDISNLTAPTLRGRYDISVGHSPTDVQIVDTLAFISCCVDTNYIRSGELLILNVSDPDTIRCVGNYHTNWYAYGVYVVGSYAYFACYDSVRIIDISNPLTPIPVGVCKISGHGGTDIFVRDTFAYVGAPSVYAGWEDGRLYIINVSNPSSPFILSNCYTPGAPVGIYIVDNYAYLSTMYIDADTGRVEGGLRVVNISNPNIPVLLASYNPPGGDALDVYVQGDLIYVGASYDGLIILRHITSGVEEKESRVESSELKVFPNPFVKYTEVRGQRTENRIQIYDIMGRLVEEERFFADAQNDRANAQNDRLKIGKDLPRGIYFVKLKGYKPVKIIKMGGVR
ncbi:MAG: T9SS type A sorting domain-containing protein [Candidatus Stahlbacteria bacterium]|nr:T9SS type A sorting domain-containing protein [Candidatus Stahlbacteria bacterium]